MPGHAVLATCICHPAGSGLLGRVRWRELHQRPFPPHPVIAGQSACFHMLWLRYTTIMFVCLLEDFPSPLALPDTQHYLLRTERELWGLLDGGWALPHGLGAEYRRLWVRAVREAGSAAQLAPRLVDIEGALRRCGGGGGGEQGAGAVARETHPRLQWTAQVGVA